MLEIKNLSVGFQQKKGTVNAVRDVSFTVGDDEIVAIVGESGSGKSVSSLAVMGLLANNAKIDGEILLNGDNLLLKNEKEFQGILGNQISMIFQEPMTSLNPTMRVGDQICEAILTHEKISKREAMGRAVELLCSVGIPAPDKRVKDFPHQMSGGMRQRVMIAMALACRPKILIADEPTTALDVTIQAQIMKLIQDLHVSYNMSVILITHDLGVVAEVADRVCVMYCGQIVENALVADLYDNPKHPYTKGLLESIPRIDEDKDRLYMIDGVVPSPQNLPEGCAFAPRCPECMEICKKQRPALVETEGRHLRCFLYHSVCEGGQK